METRILKINLSGPLRAQGLTKAALSTRIGISPQKLTKILNDEWPYITRDAIERTADYLRLPASEIFQLVHIDFWKQIHESKQCTFVRGSQNKKGNVQEITIPRSDDDATNEITGFLGDFMSEFTFADPRLDVDELVNRAKSENCIVIGSPKSNAATEILLSHFFRAEPFNSSDENRLKIPFGFCWEEDDNDIVKKSSLTCSSMARKRTKNRGPGIAVRGGTHVPADYMNPKAFGEWSPKVGKDCGLVFVANKPFGTKQDVKLIVLAGFSGIGTLGAARALIEDFRYLEPYQDEDCVYGLVQCWYNKTANNNIRSFKDFRWRFRKGGAWPIKGKQGRNGKK